MIQGARSSLKGKYANYFEIGRNKDELIILFGQRYVGDKDLPQIHTRIIMSPANGKTLVKTLQKALDRPLNTSMVVAEHESGK